MKRFNLLSDSDLILLWDKDSLLSDYLSDYLLFENNILLSWIVLQIMHCLTHLGDFCERAISNRPQKSKSVPGILKLNDKVVAKT